jgi:hypothetical protein
MSLLSFEPEAESVARSSGSVNAVPFPRRCAPVAPRHRGWQIPSVPFDWRRIRLTEHMTEAAAVLAECQVVFDFEGQEHTVYDVQVLAALKGGGDQPFFALATNRDDPGAFRPLGGGATPEEALQQCLDNAGVYHRRRVKQQGE